MYFVQWDGKYVKDTITGTLQLLKGYTDNEASSHPSPTIQPFIQNRSIFTKAIWSDYSALWLLLIRLSGLPIYCVYT